MQLPSSTAAFDATGPPQNPGDALTVHGYAGGLSGLLEGPAVADGVSVG